MRSHLDGKEKEFFDKNPGKYVGMIGNIVNCAIAGSELLVNKGVNNVIKTVKNDYKKETNK
ncbi:MAG: hypothetical protein QXU82_00320 [Candidatus Aenigmatarchaeota archaeon]